MYQPRTGPRFRCAILLRGGSPERQLQSLHEGAYPDADMQAEFTADPRGWLVRLFETVAQRERAELLTARQETAEARRKS